VKKLIFFLFAFLLFFTPLILWPFTSEVFEFNKMVLVYILTTLIIATWIIRCILERKFIFQKTLLDIPLLIFLLSQIISTIFSLDPQTSLFGYYSRFNGGLLSTICYSLLYWAFVSNLDKKSALRTLYCVLFSAVIVCIYGILQHFGIDKNIWVQDVQSRVFSTLGQPNWLAAFLVALLPIIFNLQFSIFNKFSNHKFINFLICFCLSNLFFITLLFTKSRSGLIAFGISSLIFWMISLIKNFRENWKSFLIFNFSFLILFFIFNPNTNSRIPQSATPALESGGTESGEIRKIVWKGALEVWRHYPIFGSGLETFAFSYPQFRPVEHNLVSEWDFIYNKAHNEYLNFAANSGAFGLISYFILILFSLVIFIKTRNYALLAGYFSLLITNFFGFSVVPTQLELFLFPAVGVVLSTEYKVQTENKLENLQKFFIFFVLCTMFYVLSRITTYWYADLLYAKKDFAGAINLQPNQAIYHNALAVQNSDLSESQKAIDLSPNNPSFKKSRFGIFLRLNDLDSAKDVLIDAIKYSPTDAKLYYNLGLTYARLGDQDKAIAILKKTINLKANYKEARLAYAFLLIEKNDKQEAKKQLEYVLQFIDPKDELTKQTLESLK
jgi:hypothetical protein